ncbi:MAG TPA: phosphoglycerate kinase [Gemmatimonadales bacterium]
MSKRTLAQLDPSHLDGQRVVVRSDLNVPMDNGTITDDTRIRASLPTIEYLHARGARIVVLSHLGRPKGRPDPRYSLQPLTRALERLLGFPVAFLPDPASSEAPAQVRRLPRGAVILGENTRFYPGEETNDGALADRFAALGDMYVNDAFGSAHRAHASTEAIAHRLKPAVAGFLMESELRFLGEAVDHPARPLLAILGGAKISGKIDLIDALLPKVERILIGGAMACTFFKAMGFETGTSLVEDDRVAMAKDLLAKAGTKLLLPTGAVIAERLESTAPTRVVPRDGIPPGWAMYDIDEGSVRAFSDIIASAKTIVWNGPMGVFETPPFDRGTLAMAHALAAATRNGAVTIVGGGDSTAAIAKAGVEHDVTHVSTGGGASLEFLEGKPLPGVLALDDA